MEEQKTNPEAVENNNQAVKTKKGFPTNTVSMILIFIIAFISGSVFSFRLYKSLFTSPSAKLDQIDSLVRSYYSGEIDDTALDDALATAYMRAINDKYGFYRNAEDSVQVENSLEGNASGIGVTVFNDQENKALSVFRVDNGSPAAKSGIKIGDKIIAIDGKTVAETGFSESVEAIKRDIGQTAEITQAPAEAAGGKEGSLC